MIFILKKIDLSLAYALAFTIPGLIIFLLFIHYFKTNTPVFNIFIDAFIILLLTVFWLYFIKLVDNRDIYGEPLNSYEPLTRWREWYYNLKK